MPDRSEQIAVPPQTPDHDFRGRGQAAPGAPAEAPAPTTPAAPAPAQNIRGQAPAPTSPPTSGGWRFTWTELSGSLGDLGTFLPLAVGLAVVCGMDFGLILIFAGLMNIATGLLFRQPIAVQPMKAIAAVAIAEGLTTGQIAAAGILMGIAVTALALIGAVDWINRVIPKPVVRGIQAGVGIKLALAGFGWVYGLDAIGWNSWLTAAVIAGAIILLMQLRQPAVLYVFLAGFGLLGLTAPASYQAITLAPPPPALIIPSASEWWVGLTRGALPQLPLTLLNSVIAVCALSADYFPGRGVPPRRMAASVGLMNLLAVPFGGMPMCHGAGGLAAQHRFGARSGASVVMLGAIKIIAGLLFGGALLLLLRSYPMSILGVVVIAAGFTLASAARDTLRGRGLFIVAVTAAIIIAVHTLAGFLAGCAIAAALCAADRFRARRPAARTNG